MRIWNINSDFIRMLQASILANLFHILKIIILQVKYIWIWKMIILIPRIFSNNISQLNQHTGLHN